MSIQRFVAFNQCEGSKETTEMPNSFIVDIENLSPTITNDSPTSSRVRLQRNLSRKGSQREDKNKNILSASSGNTDKSSSTGATSMIDGCYPDKSTPNLGTNESIKKQPQSAITCSAAKGCNSRKSIKQCNSFVDPRRILFFFSALSSMGTIILIYFTLSINRYSGSGDTQVQQ